MAVSPPPPGKLAGTARVGEKGQIVIPKDIRDMFGISPGDTLLLLADVGKGIAVLPKEMAVGLVETVLGESPAATFDNRGEASGSG
ncbi:AbrB/MazE/SpoVT family DNA-binding domain-containing protein [Nonomuraea turcica]|uniref:AbrB/MazE/SpoVT family DNA-binding domain-containing protein n=1 Tax=Nonomuraea sp. G32 TaxID=3067274 RepID=UPI00273CDFA2|nr:AbrB/MazE/SpoVT family DNA-binding domain-containing protein [Nonomuraea sp. G32]MDP4510127.1 AbrB/MazE/SpoVT family DNA-binding domain-containing protein [Nonomuraea sp. G32]